ILWLLKAGATPRASGFIALLMEVDKVPNSVFKASIIEILNSADPEYVTEILNNYFCSSLKNSKTTLQILIQGGIEPTKILHSAISHFVEIDILRELVDLGAKPTAEI